MCWSGRADLWGPAWDKLTFPYPYKPDDGREQLQAPDDIYRVVRGGAFWGDLLDARCAYRDGSVARGVDWLHRLSRGGAPMPLISGPLVSGSLLS